MNLGRATGGSHFTTSALPSPGPIPIYKGIEPEYITRGKLYVTLQKTTIGVFDLTSQKVANPQARHHHADLDGTDRRS